MAWRTHPDRGVDGARRSAMRARRHQPVDRSVLERAGWRTTLEYRENHRRSRDGVLGAVEIEWHAEAERTEPGGEVRVVAACGATPNSAWRRLWRIAARVEHRDVVAR